MLKIIALIGLFFLSSYLRAQPLEIPKVVSSAGGELIGSTIHVDFSVGEIAIATFSSNSAKINEGFLQYFPPKKIIEPNKPVVTIFSDSTLKVYELITPNGDGKNDFFYVNGIHIYPQNELMIVNKWGDVMYKASNYTNTWDGGDLPDGSYFYVLRLLSENKILSGGLTLAR